MCLWYSVYFSQPNVICNCKLFCKWLKNDCALFANYSILWCNVVTLCKVKKQKIFCCCIAVHLCTFQSNAWFTVIDPKSTSQNIIWLCLIGTIQQWWKKMMQFLWKQILYCHTDMFQTLHAAWICWSNLKSDASYCQNRVTCWSQNSRLSILFSWIYPWILWTSGWPKTPHSHDYNSSCHLSECHPRVSRFISYLLRHVFSLSITLHNIWLSLRHNEQ